MEGNGHERQPGGRWLPRICLLALLVLPWLAWDTGVFRQGFYLLAWLPALVCLVRQGLPWRPGQRLAVTIFASFLGYLAISLFWSDALPGEWLGYLALIAVFVLGVAGMERRHLEHVILHARPWPWVLVVVLSVIVQWYLYHGGYNPRGLPRFYLFGLGHPLLSGNVIGAMMTGVWARLVLVSESRMNKGLLSIALAAMLFAVLMTKTRSALLGFMVASALLLWRHPGRQALLLLLLAGVIMVLLALFYAPILERGLSNRPDIWWSTLQQAWKAPWFGHGLGMDPQYPIPKLKIIFFDAHNSFIAVLYYGGVVALLGWLASLASAAWPCFVRRGDALATLCLTFLAYTMTASFFEGGYFVSRPRPNWYYLWVPLALCLLVSAGQGRGDRPAVDEPA